MHKKLGYGTWESMPIIRVDLQGYKRNIDRNIPGGSLDPGDVVDSFNIVALKLFRESVDQEMRMKFTLFYLHHAYTKQL